MAVSIPDSALEITGIRARGPGGQNVNKVESAVHLRFDLASDCLTDAQRARILASGDHRITRDGVIVIKAGRFRTRERNVEDARTRLHEMIDAALAPRKPRRATVVPATVRRKRLRDKALHGRTKRLRGAVRDEE